MSQTRNVLRLTDHGRRDHRQLIVGYEPLSRLNVNVALRFEGNFFVRFNGSAVFVFHFGFVAGNGKRKFFRVEHKRRLFDFERAIFVIVADFLRAKSKQSRLPQFVDVDKNFFAVVGHIVQIIARARLKRNVQGVIFALPLLAIELNFDVGAFRFKNFARQKIKFVEMFQDIPSVCATTFRSPLLYFVEKIDTVDINSARDNRQFFIVVLDRTADADFQFGRNQISFEEV